MTERRTKKGRFAIRSEPGKLTATALPDGRYQIGSDVQPSAPSHMLRRYIEEAAALITKATGWGLKINEKKPNDPPPPLTASDLAHQTIARAESALRGLADAGCGKEEAARRCLEAAAYYEMMLTVEFEGAFTQVEGASHSGKSRAAGFKARNEAIVKEYEGRNAAGERKISASIAAEERYLDGKGRPLTADAVEKTYQRHRKRNDGQ